MLRADHFKLGSKTYKIFSSRIYFKDLDVITLNQQELMGFNQHCYDGHFGVWKNGNVYLKSDNDINLQAFIGKKINELKCPIFLKLLES